jgi:putative flippase GtrA
MMYNVPRYIFVGLTCALLQNAVIIGLDLLGVHYAVSVLIAYVGVVAYGFTQHCYFTFEQRPSAKSFLRYATGMATNYPIYVALMFVFCDGAGLSVPIAAPLTTVLLFAWNYLAASWAITGKPAVEEDASPTRIPHG